jgi:spore germination protein YaaH
MKKYFITILVATLLVFVSAQYVKLSSNEKKLETFNSEEISVSDKKLIGTWFFPGQCRLDQSLGKIPKIDIIKPQWATLSESGDLEIYKQNEICDGFSVENVKKIKEKSNRQYLNVVSLKSLEPMRKLFSSFENQQKFINDSRIFLKDIEINFAGIEIDFELSAQWTVNDFENYLSFLKLLKDDFHKNNLEVIIDMPAIDNVRNLQENTVYKYAEVSKLDLDGYVLMMYDFMYGNEKPTGISPEKWVRDVVSFAKESFDDDEKLIAGMHSYGYKAEKEKPVIDNVQTFQFEVIKDTDLSKNAIRDDSGELYSYQENFVYYFADSYFLNKRFQFLTNELKIGQVNVWQLIGNPWFI